LFRQFGFNQVMPRRKASSQRIARQVSELAFAAPQVVMHRTARMAGAGPGLSARDRAEFTRMGSEKVAAFYQSWAGMWAEAFAIQYELGSAMSFVALTVATGGQASAASAVAATSNATAKILSAGLAPIHKTAVANARRISRTKR
jgi:hypothetical protein